MSLECNVQFNDSVLLEANGEFAEACKIMEKDLESTIGKQTPWTLRSSVIIYHPLGVCMFSCSFYNTGKVYIDGYKPSSKDINNIDVQCLTNFLHEKKWKTPEPLPGTVDEWKFFWRYKWQTYLVQSEYLEKKYGPRTTEMTDEDVETDFISDAEDDL